MKEIKKGINNEDVFTHCFGSNAPVFYLTAGITHPEPKYEIQRIEPPDYTFEYVLGGKCAIQIDDKIFTAETGDVIILPPCSFRHFYSDKKNPIKKKWFIANCNFSYIALLIKAYRIENIVHVKNVENTNIPQIFDNILNMIKANPEMHQRALELEIHKLIGEISDCAASSNSPQSIAEQGKMHMDRMLNTHFTIDDVCGLIGISRSQFFRLFKKEYGISPTVYVINQKIELSKKMLENDTISITNIANSFDFSSSAHYSSTFKKLVGMTPLEYRKAHVQQDEKTQ